MGRLGQLLMATAALAAMSPSGGGADILTPTKYVGTQLPRKEWKRRKARMKMQKASRRANY